MLKRFIASPISGYILIALVVAAAGAGVWFWSELKEFGSLEAKAQSQAETIAVQERQLSVINEQLQKKQLANTKLSNQMAQIRRTFGAVENRIREAESNANKALSECMDMHIADGMRFGPSREDADGNDKARTSVDG